MKILAAIYSAKTTLPKLPKGVLQQRVCHSHNRINYLPSSFNKESLMAFTITTLRTGQISKVEFKSNPDLSNLAFEGYGPAGEALLITGIPSGLGGTLALIREWGSGFNRQVYVEVEKRPEQIGGAYYEANYAGRIEIR
jgi:hypothetical protein